MLRSAQVYSQMVQGGFQPLQVRYRHHGCVCESMGSLHWVAPGSFQQRVFADALCNSAGTADVWCCIGRGVQPITLAIPSWEYIFHMCDVKLVVDGALIHYWWWIFRRTTETLKRAETLSPIDSSSSRSSSAKRASLDVLGSIPGSLSKSVCLFRLEITSEM